MAREEILRDPQSYGIAPGCISDVLKRLDGELDTANRKIVFKRGGGIGEAVAYVKELPGSSHLFAGYDPSSSPTKLARTPAELRKRLDDANGVAARTPAEMLNRHKDVLKVDW